MVVVFVFGGGMLALYRKREAGAAVAAERIAFYPFNIDCLPGSDPTENGLDLFVPQRFPGREDFVA
jgi:hypothetical protein